jgi:hypothetical protein
MIQIMLTSLINSSYEDGIMLDKPNSPLLCILRSCHCGKLHAHARADEFHSTMRTNLLQIVYRRQFS